MISNYLRSALRNFRRNKSYAVINTLGLSLGLTATIFILLYINDELGYDKHFPMHERIYRLESDFNINNKHDRFAVSALPLGPAIQLEMPEVEAFCRFDHQDNTIFRYNDKEFFEKNAYMADSTAPYLFSLHFIEGNPDKALTDPFTVILSKKNAQKYFGEGPAYGKILLTPSGRSYKVTGVFEDLPQNSHMPFDLLMSMETLATFIGAEQYRSMASLAFWNVGFYTYILLKPNTEMGSILKKFPAFYDKYMKEIGDQINANFELKATRIDKVHHTSHLDADLPTGNMAYIYVFSAVAVFIILLAAINYMNLATARAANRAREVGLRKVVGANRGQLAGQFMSESMLLALLSMIISLILIKLFIPLFNQISGKTLSFSLLTDPEIIFGILTITLITGLISGIYPALFLSSFQPAVVLKGKIKIGSRGTWLRKGLVAFQLLISIVMITGSIVIFNQLHFMQRADMGFEKDNIMVLEAQDTTFRRRTDSFKSALLQNPNILNVAMSRGIPGGNMSIQVVRVEKENKMQDYALNLLPCDYDFLELLQVPFVKGRNFNREMGSDKETAVIVNEATVREMGWGEHALGKRIHWGFEIDGSGGRIMKVIGVVKDFNYVSLHNAIEPIIMFIPGFPLNMMSVRIKPGTEKNSIEFIRQKWGEANANRPFDYYFMDKSFESKYQAESNLGQVFSIFAILSIFIALLGLIGLSSFMALQRTKEIGVRKVLGASIQSIMLMLYRESVLLVFMAFTIALPLSWYMLHRWLENFAYHISLSWFIFALAGLLVLAITLISVSFHAIKAALSNPVVAIKYE
ncbi:MAG: ABC transporter permease [Lentimicrobium sp.]|jgi:putative ABC transport system permease protein|nr:ABC transporter permease [Lentimicrobium sp.]